MAPNSTATFAIGVSDPTSASVEDIEGMTFTLQIASGAASTPSITSVDFLSNTVWSGSIASAVPESSGAKPQFVSFDPITDGNANPLYISANGTLANVTFNTNGALNGSSYTLSMTGFSDVGNDSNFTDGLGNTVDPGSVVFQAGTLYVQTAVPEPSIGFFFAGSALLFLARRPRRHAL